jgi:hypothetical protein
MSEKSAGSDVVAVTLTFDRREMARRGAIGGRVTALKHDARETSLPGREAFLSRFGSPEEKNEYFRRIGRLGAEARRRRATETVACDATA